MIELFERDMREYDRQSSKGNQLKWFSNNTWYKADYTGYEGLTEYVVSRCLKLSTLNENEYILYNTENMKYKYATYKGCSSDNFLPARWNLITLERLFQNTYNESLNKAIYSISDYENRIKFLVEQTIRITGLKDFGKYHYCPIFDNGAALLSDTTIDYPMNVPISELVENVRAKTFCTSFDEQLDIAEKLYGQHIRFEFDEKEIESILSQESHYANEVKVRVKNILLIQRRKYQYLFQ